MWFYISNKQTVCFWINLVKGERREIILWKIFSLHFFFFLLWHWTFLCDSYSLSMRRQTRLARLLPKVKVYIENSGQSIRNCHLSYFVRVWSFARFSWKVHSPHFFSFFVLIWFILRSVQHINYAIKALHFYFINYNLFRELR